MSFGGEAAKAKSTELSVRAPNSKGDFRAVYCSGVFRYVAPVTPLKPRYRRSQVIRRAFRKRLPRRQKKNPQIPSRKSGVRRD